MARTQVNRNGWPVVEVTSFDVVICGTRVPRPKSIAPSQWLDFWERVRGEEEEEKR